MHTLPFNHTAKQRPVFLHDAGNKILKCFEISIIIHYFALRSYEKNGVLLMNNIFKNMMKKVEFYFVKSLITAFVCFLIIACDESSERISAYDMFPVSRYEKETEPDRTERILMSHNDRNVREFKLYDGDLLTCTANVFYRADGIVCTLNDIQYHIEPDNVLGGSRARKITASKNGALYYEVEYFYANERLVSAQISVSGDSKSPYYTSYSYDDSRITINESSGGNSHEIKLCNEENTGYAYNVLGHTHAETSLTSQYVINPALYFLNLYGKPVEKLPDGHEIERSGKTMRVGKHLYEYRD
jgi:hypothetical protein